MKVSELIARLQGVLAKEGDINVYIGDMEAPQLRLNETLGAEDVEVYGKTYVSIEDR